MPNIRPFRGLRYNTKVTGDIKEVVAPPYDIIFDEWRDRLYDRSPYNIVRLIKNREEPGDSGPDEKYTRSAQHITGWMQEDALILDDEPSIYICSDTFEANGETHTRYGFISIMKIEEFGNGVYPHELTLSAPKIDRLNLVRTTNTNMSQIFSVFRDPASEVQSVVERAASREPDINFIDDQGIERRMWVVRNPAIIDRIVELMRDRDIIIADGHHRYETAQTYKTLMDPQRTGPDEPFDYVSMYFSSADAPGMTILPTHRKVSGVSTFKSSTFFAELAKLFDVSYLGDIGLNDVIREISPDAENQNTFGIYTCDGYGTARYFDPETPKELDVEILHDIVIEKLLGISAEEIAAGQHVHFCKSAQHAIEDVADSNDQISFLMNPIRPEELFSKVLRGGRMPQKSTYFYPKTMCGLVMYRLDGTSLK
jgi:uncharacterized protein (DUF1015 family)